MISELKFEAPPWNQIYDMLVELSQKIHDCGFDSEVIVGISRGGLIPSRILSDLLENPHITSVTAEFYVGVNETNCEPKLVQPIPISVFDKKILLVDDVADSGRNAMLIKDYLCREKMKELKILTLYYKPWSKLVPDFYSEKTSNWIVFPWEIKETLRKLLNKCNETQEPFENAFSKLIEAGVNKELIEHLLTKLT
ncbi:MAG: phosphoribosyltransferase [Candidatus Bathyarchaeia archaeon]